jgi:hypothetical protein
MPAPHLLGITDNFYDDEEEWNDALAVIYRTLMRSMRDTGISGHVLICDTLEEAEVTSLIRQNVFFFMQEPVRDDLVCLMEHQPQIAVGRDQLDTLPISPGSTICGRSFLWILTVHRSAELFPALIPTRLLPAVIARARAKATGITLYHRQRLYLNRY